MRRLATTLAAAALLALPAGASAGSPVEIRHVDFGSFPLVRVTALVAAGVHPELTENGRPAAFAKARQLGSAEALMLALDNSSSMTGRPLREAKAAARDFLSHEQQATSTGFVAFGHEALVLTRQNESNADVARTLSQIAPDVQTGTSLYDAVVSSTQRLQKMSAGTRILILLTDGHDVGSHASLRQAISAAQRASVVVYAIAAGQRADTATLSRLTGETGGRLFDANDVSQLGAVYAALGRELDHTWQISYLSRARPGDSVSFALRTGAGVDQATFRVPGTSDKPGPLPADLAHSGTAAAVFVLLTALLLAVAVSVVIRRRQKPEVVRLLQPHLQPGRDKDVKRQGSGRFEGLTAWTESALEDLPGSDRLTRAVERSGLKVRPGHVPWLALAGAFVFGIIGMILGAGALLAFAFLALGLAAPFIVFSVAASKRRKAFDRQLPDVLATVASTLRAGHGLRIALRAVADDGSPPASVEFGRVLAEERLGRPLHEAIEAMCKRVGSEDLDYVATAINVQSQAGGSLATLFDTLSETVRERQRHARKVRALTSMGRMSATILVCLPFALAALMTFVNPGYMKPFYTTSTGQTLIVICLISMSIGALLLKKIVSVKY
ncbi:MAG TPA: VWA domain-containing protein [Gaiellaceae bacterium]|nr:VWA domain-containing protein [Gaiellaceae bacterium]